MSLIVASLTFWHTIPIVLSVSYRIVGSVTTMGGEVVHSILQSDRMMIWWLGG